jgi:MOSC domain-containing protein YiiM
LYRYLFPAMWISWVIYWWISGDQFRKTSRGAMASGNIEGDPQSDPSVHGGPQKAVYAYPAEHYDFWRHELPDAELAWGAFGENFVRGGLRESITSRECERPSFATGRVA